MSNDGPVKRLPIIQRVGPWIFGVQAKGGGLNRLETCTSTESEKSWPMALFPLEIPSKIRQFSPAESVWPNYYGRRFDEE
jgi:hypothetical protein